jgi:hypothetical protein
MFFYVQLYGIYNWCFCLMYLRFSYYPLANEVATGYSNATVRPSFRNILVSTLEIIQSGSIIVIRVAVSAINNSVTTRSYYYHWISRALLHTNISCLGGVFAYGIYNWCFCLMYLRFSYYPLANEVATGYSNATVRPFFRNILVSTLEWEDNN